MTTLLENSLWENVDIIAIQKLWQNSEKWVIYCSSNEQFWSFYSTQFKTRVCFLINKKLKLFIYSVVHSREDVNIFSLHIKENQINIINIYFELSESHINSHSQFLIHKFDELILSHDSIIITEDFNVHHESWEDDSVNKSHDLALTLKDSLKALSLNIITFRKKKIFHW